MWGKRKTKKDMMKRERHTVTTTEGKMDRQTDTHRGEHRERRAS